MANAKLSPGIASLSGKLSKQKEVTTRTKAFRNQVTGQVVKYGPQEYFFREKRNYKLSPRTEAEQAQHDRWQAACRLSSQIRKNPDHPRYAELYQRWRSQLSGTPDAAFLNRPKKPKIYPRFDTFLNALLLTEQ